MFPLAYKDKDSALRGFAEVDKAWRNRKNGARARFYMSKDGGWTVDLESVIAIATVPVYSDPVEKIAEKLERDDQDDQWWRKGGKPPWER